MFIYFGGPGGDAAPDLELTAIPNDFFGSEVACADFNGDGISDVIVGSRSGIRVYYGGADMDPAEDFRLAGGTINGDYWSAFTPAGDVNGDGSADIVVGAVDRAYIFFGGTTADSVPDVTLRGPDGVSSFGSAAASLGDVNGDGFSDLLVGADFGPGGGKVYLFLGGAPMDSIADTEIGSTVPLAGFGLALSAADVNGDGVADALIPLPGDCTSGGEPVGTVFVYDFSTPLPSRAFLRGENRTISLGHGSSLVCIRFEPVNDTYANADVDLSTVRLVSNGTGEVNVISSVAPKSAIVGDEDRNGIVELSACFAPSDLWRLFSSVKGRQVMDVELDGRLTSHRRFLAPIRLTIVGATASEHRTAASVSPNPLNPEGALRFTTTRRGSVTVRLYDVTGRLVRTLIDSERLEAGEHAALIDGRDTRGVALATGVYFYSIQSSEGVAHGRIVVAK